MCAEDQSYDNGDNGDNVQEDDGTHVKIVAESDDDDDISARLSDSSEGEGVEQASEENSPSSPISPASQLPTNFDPIKQLEDSYVKVFDRSTENMNELKYKIGELKSELRKIPHRIHDLIKKDLQANAKSVNDLTAQLSENETLRTQNQYLTNQVHAKSQEIWSLKQELSRIKSAKHYGSPRPSTMDGGVPPSASSSPSASSVSSASPSASTPSNTPPSGPSSEPAASESHGASVSASHGAPAGALRMQAGVTQGLFSRGDQREVNTDQDHRSTHTNVQNTHTDSRIPRATPNTPPPNRTLDVPGDAAHLNAPTPRQDDEGQANRTNTSRTSTDSKHPQATGGDRYDRSSIEAVLIADSTSKYGDKDKFMGRHRAFIQRASTSVTAKDISQNWSQNDNMKFAVLHVGVNDVRGGTSSDELVGNLKDSLVNMQMKFQNARVAFTEILYVGAENTQPQFNTVIKSVNYQMENLCSDNGFVFVRHPTLQSPDCDLYDDDVHINRSGGTAVFVSDIHRAIGLYQNDRTRSSQVYDRGGFVDRPRRFQDSNARRGDGAGQSRGQSQRQNPAPENSNLNQMLALLALNMLQTIQAPN